MKKGIVIVAMLWLLTMQTTQTQAVGLSSTEGTPLTNNQGMTAIESEVAEGELVYNGTQYLYVVGDKKRFYKSVDGQNWEIYTPIMAGGETAVDYIPLTNFTTSIKEAICVNNTFVIATKDEIYTSQDGVSWFRHELKDSAQEEIPFLIDDIVYRNGTYILTGVPIPDGGGMFFTDAAFLYSEDLETFFPGTAKDLGVSLGHTRSVSIIVESPHQLLGFGSDETIMVTTDGKFWQGFKGTAVGGNGIWDGQKYVTAYNEKMAYSTDGIHWTVGYEAQDAAALYLDQVSYNGSCYIATGKQRVDNPYQDWIYYYSTDGMNWEKRVLPQANLDVYDIYPTTDGFIVGGNKLYYLQPTAQTAYVPPTVTYQDTKIPDYGTLITETKESASQIKYNRDNHLMAITTNHNLYEWGESLGRDVDNFIGIPRKILTNVRHMFQSAKYAGAVTHNNELYVWGQNSNQMLRVSGELFIPHPIKVMDGVVDAAISREGILALKADGTLLFGDAKRGYETIASNVRDVECSYENKAYITTNNELYMWGGNSYGQLGTGNLEGSLKPIKIMDNVAMVCVEPNETVVLTLSGDTYVMGNFSYKLDMPRAPIMTPIKIASHIKHATMGGELILINQQNEALYWGKSTKYYGEKEIGKVIGTNVKDAVSQRGQAILVKTNGEVIVLYGDNGSGQLGTGDDKHVRTHDPIKMQGFTASLIQ